MPKIRDGRLQPSVRITYIHTNHRIIKNVVGACSGKYGGSQTKEWLWQIYTFACVGGIRDTQV